MAVRVFLIFWLFAGGTQSGWSQASNALPHIEHPATKRVLMIFGEARDLPGNVTMEQAARAELQADTTNRVEFFIESMDAGRFPNFQHYQQFRDYIKNRYAGQNLDLVMMFLSRDFKLAGGVPSVLATNLPLVFVVVNDLNEPGLFGGMPATGIFQRFDIDGTIRFIFHLQPETRHVVVIGGNSKADQAVEAQIVESSRSVAGVDFEFWTNRPVAEIVQNARSLASGTVILLSSVQRDAVGEPFYTSEVARMLAPVASVPVYVLGAGSVGSGALGGSVIDLEGLGAGAGKLASLTLAGRPVSQIPAEVRTNGIAMVDWRALQRWDINPNRLPTDCRVLYRPHTAWESHRTLILSTVTIVVLQAVTIAGLLVQRRQRQRAEAEIQRQRAELAHVARVSTMGQLASALTHELNQPLGAILRNAEAAEVFLQSDRPDLAEVRAILADIRRDDKRAGNVIERMRSLYRRRALSLGSLDLCDLVEDTVALARVDIAQRHIRVALEIPPHLPAAQGDRVHVQQVLLNLILNGMDAMNTIPKARRTLSVRVGETKNGNLHVSVLDCGIGIAPDDAAHIFEPFFTTKSNGMGMGLAISKTIIEAHGGDIWMESSAMEGTKFTFLLPRAGQQKVKAGDLPAQS